MYRATTVQVDAGDDSNLIQKTFGRKAVFTQTKDQESASPVVRIAPADAEALVSIAPVTTGYFAAIFSDYPIRVRFNSPTGTQFTMRSNGVSPTSIGAPLPDQCVLVMPCEVTAIYLAPIPAAAQTANVRICVTGDPTSSYV